MEKGFLPKQMTYFLTPPRTPFKNYGAAAMMAYGATRPTALRNQYRYGDGTRTYTQTNKRRRSSFKTSFKQLMLKNTAAKHKTANSSTTMLQNNLYTWNISGLIVQGDTNQDRDGDHVNLEALKLRGFVDSATTAGAYSFRIIVGYSSEEYAATTFTTAGLTAGEIFLPNGTSNYTSLVNPKTFTCLWDENIDINSQVAGAQDISSILKTVSLKRGFNYQNSAAIYGKDTNLYVVVVGIVIGGTNGVTIMGETSLSMDCIFK